MIDKQLFRANDIRFENTDRYSAEKEKHLSMHRKISHGHWDISIYIYFDVICSNKFPICSPNLLKTKSI